MPSEEVCFFWSKWGNATSHKAYTVFSLRWKIHMVDPTDAAAFGKCYLSALDATQPNSILKYVCVFTIPRQLWQLFKLFILTKILTQIRWGTYPTKQWANPGAAGRTHRTTGICSASEQQHNHLAVLQAKVTKLIVTVTRTEFTQHWMFCLFFNLNMDTANHIQLKGC